MNYRRSICILVFTLIASVYSPALLAEKITLKDGTVYEGAVIKRGDIYWIKPPNEEAIEVPVADVAFVGEPPTESIDGPADEAPDEVRGIDLLRRQADAAPTALEAMMMWLRFSDEGASGVEQSTAVAEIDRWRDRADAGAIRINTKWIGGAELQQLQRRVELLCEEARELTQSNRAAEALTRLADADTLIPDDLQTLHTTVQIAIRGKRLDEAMKAADVAVKISPESAAVWSNHAVVRSLRKQHVGALESISRAIELSDELAVAHNFAYVLTQAPPILLKERKFLPLVEKLATLAETHALSAAVKTYEILAAPAPPAAQNFHRSGTGFFVTDTGIVLTDAAVIEGASEIVLVLDDGSLHLAELMSSPADGEVAALQMRSEMVVKAVRFAAAADLLPGATMTVMGAPLSPRFSGEKIVTSVVEMLAPAPTPGITKPATFRARIDRGLSGGPILDAQGLVIGMIHSPAQDVGAEPVDALPIAQSVLREAMEKQGLEPTAGKPSRQAPASDAVAGRVRPTLVRIVVLRK